MSKVRKAFVASWIGTVALLFLAGVLDRHISLDLATERVILASAAGTIALVILGSISYWKSRNSEIVMLALGLACSPFIIGLILTASGLELNVHATSTAGLYLYGLLTGITAIILLLSVPVRAMLRQ
jgi:hypothetical protein